MDPVTIGVWLGAVAGTILNFVLHILSDGNTKFLSNSLLVVSLASCSILGGIISYSNQEEEVVTRDVILDTDQESKAEHASQGSIVVYDSRQTEFGGGGSYLLVIDVSDGKVRGLDEWGEVQLISLEEVDHVYDPVIDPGTKVSIEAHTYLRLLAFNFSK